MKTITKKLIITAIIGILALVIGAEISFAATATFTGSIDDDGGDPNLTVWFQYGKTTSYGYETSHQSKYGTGEFTATVSGLENCTTYHYRAVAKHQDFNDTMYGQDKTFTTECNNSPTVDIKANNSDGPITIAYNTSAILTWTSNNADYCTASGDWSGSKAISGSESTGNLTSSKTYTLTCSGPGGSASDSVTVNVSTQLALIVKKLVRNLSDGSGWLDLVAADPNEIVSFSIRVMAGGQSVAKNIIVKDTLPAQIIYRGNLRIDNISSSGDIISGLSIGDLSPGQSKTITFEARVAPEGQFNYGDTNLINTAMAYNLETASTDTAKIVVSKKAVAGVATEVKTGIASRAFDYILLPFVITLIIILVFKNYFILLSGWLEKRKNEMIDYRTKRTLRKVISKIKAKEKLS